MVNCCVSNLKFLEEGEEEREEEEGGREKRRRPSEGQGLLRGIMVKVKGHGGPGALWLAFSHRGNYAPPLFPGQLFLSFFRLPTSLRMYVLPSVKQESQLARTASFRLLIGAKVRLVRKLFCVRLSRFL
ncbi:hypothetical protein E2C01_071083 [Portunus trituberculatus]|uniref:Uncharacterized protein n=1 Tax=Portunus trituberculatus TaxID=210409 RepID=A0A5B7I4A9_PORTR|nr:hypothetical protein [Portunus trituberculatus]